MKRLNASVATALQCHDVAEAVAATARAHDPLMKTVDLIEGTRAPTYVR